MSDCPICNSKLVKYEYRNTDTTYYECYLCGKFEMSRIFSVSLNGIMAKEKDTSARISHSIRQSYENGNIPFLSNNMVNQILTKPLPNPKEQSDLLIRWLGKNLSGPGEYVYIGPIPHQAIIGAKSEKGYSLIVEHLKDIALIAHPKDPTAYQAGKTPFTLTFKGWEYYEKLKFGATSYRKAFMAMKFGDPLLDKVVKDVFKPCVRQTGFELNKLDDNPKAGLIDDRLRVEIQSSDFVIADLTDDNLGAYWEAGYAEGLSKPVIYTCEKHKFEEKKTHFDTNHHLTIVWEKDNPTSCVDSLKATIRVTLPHLAKMD